MLPAHGSRPAKEARAGGPRPCRTAAPPARAFAPHPVVVGAEEGLGGGLLLGQGRLKVEGAPVAGAVRRQSLGRRAGLGRGLVRLGPHRERVHLTDQKVRAGANV